MNKTGCVVLRAQHTLFIFSYWERIHEDKCELEFKYSLVSFFCENFKNSFRKGSNR